MLPYMRHGVRLLGATCGFVITLVLFYIVVTPLIHSSLPFDHFTVQMITYIYTALLITVCFIGLLAGSVIGDWGFLRRLKAEEAILERRKSKAQKLLGSYIVLFLAIGIVPLLIVFDMMPGLK